MKKIITTDFMYCKIYFSYVVKSGYIEYGAGSIKVQYFYVSKVKIEVT